MSHLSSVIEYDLLIIGSGAAGLALALSLADSARVALLSKDDLLTSSSERAQGGIAAVMSEEDSHTSHIQDTLLAGAGLCDPAVVEFTVRHAKDAITWLVAQGVEFSYTQTSSAHKPGHYHLTREGGHSHRRILHATDRTGAVVVKTLAEQVAAHPNIDCFTQCIAVDLLIYEGQCFGARVLNQKTQNLQTFFAKQTVLATGGASQVYRYTSNPRHACGDGIAMAYRAGCKVANMEFIQFHPTCLYQTDCKQIFLISEALRGEGGLLKLPDGQRFMLDYDSRAELASRDIVARAIDVELKKNKINYVHLDISHQSPEWIQKTFPSIYQTCLNAGINITQTPIPVVPAAHYTCGGVMTNLHGQTNIPRLYAVGEVAYTGLHGANRLASNSLLECLVFAKSAAESIQKSGITENIVYPHFVASKNTRVNLTEQHKWLPEIISLTEQLRELMWQQVGIVRNNNGLLKAKNLLQHLKIKHEKIEQEAWLCQQFIELRNLIQNAELMVESALLRQESRGLHFNTDYPHLQEKPQPTIL